jgi:hypothetical protein
MTKLLVIALLLAACGGSKSSTDDDTLPDDLSKKDPDAVPDEPVQTEIQRRQAAACEQLGPRITECAIEDARAQMSPEEFAKLDVANTGKVHTREFIKDCNASPMSSRQVRVYEVCPAEETECGALLACLENADPDHATEPAPAADE